MIIKVNTYITLLYNNSEGLEKWRELTALVKNITVDKYNTSRENLGSAQFAFSNLR